MLSLRAIAMLMFTPTAMLMGVWKPFYGLLMLVFLYYFRPDVWGMPDWFRPIQLITLAVAVGWFVRVRTFRFTPLMVLGVLVVIASIASAFNAAVDRKTALDGAFTMTKIVAVMFFTIQFVDTPKKINMFLWANVAGMVYNLKAILYTGITGGGTRANVAVGQGEANYVAMVLAMSMPFLLMKFMSGGPKEKKFALILIPPYLLSAVFTGSRSGMLAMAACLGLVVLNTKRKVLGVSAAAVLGLAFFIAMPEEQIERLKQGVGPEEKRDASAQARVRLWRAARRMWSENIFLGKGFNNFPLLSARYTGFTAGKSAGKYRIGRKNAGFVAHSLWFQALAEGGLALALPLFSMFPMALLALRRVQKLGLPPPYDLQFRVWTTGAQGVLIAFMIGSTFGSYLTLDFIWWYFGLVSAIVLVAERVMLLERRRQREEGRASGGVDRTWNRVAGGTPRLQMRPGP